VILGEQVKLILKFGYKLILKILKFAKNLRSTILRILSELNLKFINCKMQKRKRTRDKHNFLDLKKHTIIFANDYLLKERVGGGTFGQIYAALN